MSRKRLPAKMTATGGACSEKSVGGKRSSALLESLLRPDPIKIKATSGGPWHVPRGFLQQDSWYFRGLLSDMSRRTELEVDVHEGPFRLFLQWLFECRYDEDDGYAFDLVTDYYDLEPCNDFDETMDWRVKAAFLACETGAKLEAPAFQNHAMRRLYDAYSGGSTTSGVVAFMLEKSIVYDHEDKAWPKLLEENNRFREKFTVAVAVDLNTRRQEYMELEGYLNEEILRFHQTTSLPFLHASLVRHPHPHPRRQNYHSTATMKRNVVIFLIILILFILIALIAYLIYYLQTRMAVGGTASSVSDMTEP
ncbi:hypothetical protein BKA63DRAFT_579546 [Paraphoma chrysanthemicola]|nr:hypothetical protein BKA63DRAFT_579546 [Paraphoma chrysanthemicola]